MPGCRVLVGPSGSAWTRVTDAHGLDIWQTCSLWSSQDLESGDPDSRS